MILPGSGGRRNLSLMIIPAALLLAAVTIRPVEIVRDHGNRAIVWLWAWQECRIRFINSVTHLPVEIRFGIPWSFSGFSAQTDPGTEEYYTAGEYVWNERLAKEHPRSLKYCSEVGMEISVGSNDLREQGGCTSLFLLWPPWD